MKFIGRDAIFICAGFASVLVPGVCWAQPAPVESTTRAAEREQVAAKLSRSAALAEQARRQQPDIALAGLLRKLGDSDSVWELYRGLARLEGLHTDSVEVRVTLRSLPELELGERPRRALLGIKRLSVAYGIVKMVRAKPLTLRLVNGKAVRFDTVSNFTFERGGQIVPLRGVEILPRPEDAQKEERLGAQAGAAQRLRGDAGAGGATSVAASAGRASVTSSASATPSEGGLTLEQLREVMPRLTQERAAALLPHLNHALEEARIDTPLRQAAFLAQIAHESAELTLWTEQGSRRYFLRYEPGRRAGRRVGNTQRGDGYRFRGRGPVQLTGRDNYQRAGRDLGLDLLGNPDLVAAPAAGFRASAWFWNQRDLNRYADRGDFRTLTRRLNGGLNHYAERVGYYLRAKRVLGAE